MELSSLLISRPLALFLLLLLAGAGCSTTATTGSRSLKGPLPVKLGNFKKVTVEVRSAITKPPKDQDKCIAFLESKIVEGLRERHVFETVSPGAASCAPGDLRVLVNLTKIHEPSGAAFFIGGVLAGPATAKATVELQGQPGNKLIGSSEVVGVSSGTVEVGLVEGTYSKGTAGEALSSLATQVVKLINNHL